jgi:hypothetical protein
VARVAVAFLPTLFGFSAVLDADPRAFGTADLRRTTPLSFTNGARPSNDLRPDVDCCVCDTGVAPDTLCLGRDADSDFGVVVAFRPEAEEVDPLRESKG